MSPAEAALLARRSDVVIVFGIRVESEGFDSADLSLPWGQDAVIEAVAAANPNTIVVLETGNPVHDAVARQGQGDRAGLVPRPGRRPGDRRDPHRRGQPLGPPAGHLPGGSRADAAAGAPRPGRAVGHADDRSSTTRAPRSATAGSPRRAKRRCTPSATASATRASPTAISRSAAARRSPQASR